ncbi:MAG: FAD-dependent oxidoreductase [Candidatus Saccharibacteria bacterium]|nr:FAD-dependent oxidoreductase [Candidatus Saccharibacteria bacterium]
MHVKHTVKKVGNLTPSIIGLVLERDPDQQMYSFQPGQYATISFMSKGRHTAERCFSISSSPTDQDTLEFGIRVGGKFTQALQKIKPGDPVSIRGPFGGFIFDAHTQENVVFCAGGIGITPFISMFRYASAIGLKNNITLLYSVRNQDEIAYYDEINQISKEHPNIRVFFVVGEGPIDKIHLQHEIYQGRISPEMLAKACRENYNQTSFFLCGPPPFMGAVVGMLEKSGVDHEHIITEAFNQGKQKGKGRGWPFNVYTIGAVSMVASTVLVMVMDMLKTIPSTVLPENLSSKETLPVATRQKEIDALINKLESNLATTGSSPAVISAEQEVLDAQAIIAAQQTNTKVTYTQAPSTATPSATPSTPTTSTPVATPVPKPAPAKTCTTSASGVKTCI